MKLDFFSIIYVIYDERPTVEPHVWFVGMRRTENQKYTCYQHGSRLDTTTLYTFMYEAMTLLNNHPLSSQNLNDSLGPEPLTLNHPIMMKYQPKKVYARHKWRQVQFLADEFWHRWKSEYMLTLQHRNKCDWNAMWLLVYFAQVWLWPMYAACFKVYGFLYRLLLAFFAFSNEKT